MAATSTTTTALAALPESAKREKKPSAFFRLLRGGRTRQKKEGGHDAKVVDIEIVEATMPQPSPPYPTSPADLRQGSVISQTPAHRFILAIDEHSAFFWSAVSNGLFDRYTFAAVFSLCWRIACAGASLDEAFSSSTLFFAMHLFWETEEDAVSGRRQLQEYVIGRDPRRGIHGVPFDSPEAEQYRARRNAWVDGWTTMWQKLGFQTLVPWETVRDVANSLPFHPFFARMRTEQQRRAINRE